MEINARIGRAQRRIRDMYVGEVGYAVPWAFTQSEDCPGTGHLDTDMSVDPGPGGTLEMRVLCTAEGRYGVDLPRPRRR